MVFAHTKLAALTPGKIIQENVNGADLHLSLNHNTRIAVMMIANIVIVHKPAIQHTKTFAQVELKN